MHKRLRGIILNYTMNDALEKRLIEALKSVDAHGDVAPAHVHDPMTMLLREKAIQVHLMRWDDVRDRYVLTGTGRRRLSRAKSRSWGSGIVQEARRHVQQCAGAESRRHRAQGLARTPGEARGIVIRKHSKILGAFSMGLASLFGFVEASHTQESRVTAIDILLEPDATMVQHAQADNARLLKAYPTGFALDPTHQPHLTLIQQFVRTADLEKVYAAANQVLAKENAASWNLKAIQVLLHPRSTKRHCRHCRRADGRTTPAATATIGRGCAFHGEDRDRCRVRERRWRTRYPGRTDRLRSEF